MISGQRSKRSFDSSPKPLWFPGAVKTNKNGVPEEHLWGLNCWHLQVPVMKSSKSSSATLKSTSQPPEGSPHTNRLEPAILFQGPEGCQIQSQQSLWSSCTQNSLIPSCSPDSQGSSVGSGLESLTSRFRLASRKTWGMYQLKAIRWRRSLCRSLTTWGSYCNS